MFSRQVFKTAFYNMSNFTHDLRLNTFHQFMLKCRCICTTCHQLQNSASPTSEAAGQEKKISQAMKMYLERAKDHEEFMTEESQAFEVGKRHLANIMGEDMDMLTQEHIDEAIRYLLPSGLFSPRSRPIMKPPLEVIPPRKAAQFGVDGRPFHHMFYTGCPNFYQVLFDIAMKLDGLKSLKLGDMSADSVPSIQLTGSEWIDKKALQKLTNETLSDRQYAQFVRILTHLASHPYAGSCRDLIFKYRIILHAARVLDEQKPVQVDDQGRKYQEEEGIRKNATATVRLYEKGRGKITINGQGLLDYFPELLDRQQLLFPLQLSNKLGLVDFEAQVEGGGHSGQAGAIRLGLSRCLQSFVDESVLEKMRLAGLLSRDPRSRERKKYGQEGARRKFTWKKR